MVSGAIILTFSAVLAKIFSAVYRIVLTRILGGEGIGLYQLIFPIYSLCVVLSTTGIPMAVSKVVSKSENSKSVVKFCFKLVAIITLSLAVIIFVFSEFLAKFQGEKDIAICFKILAPTLIFVGISSVLRGYFQGIMMYFPPAMSQVFEQFIKLIFGLILSSALIKFSVVYAIVGAILSISLSEMISFLVLFSYYKKSRYKRTENEILFSKKEVLKDIFPITLTNLILPFAFFLDSLIVVKLLNVNFDKNVSVYLYGLETGVVNSIVTLPTMFSFALASVVMPNFSRRTAKADNINSVVKFVFLVTLPCCIIFLLDPETVLTILYGERLSNYGLEGIDISAQLLRIGAVGTLFLSLNQIYSSFLQAKDKRFVTIKNLLIGVIIKFVLEIVLVLNINVNIFALALANSVCYILIFIMNKKEAKKCYKIKKEPMFYLKNLCCVLLMLLGYGVISCLGVGLFNRVLTYFVSVGCYFTGVYLLDIMPIKKYFVKKIQ